MMDRHPFRSLTLSQKSMIFPWQHNIFMATVATYRSSMGRGTVDGSVGHLFCNFQHIFSVFILDSFSCQYKENTLKLLQRGLRNTQNFIKKHLKYRETTIHQHTKLKFFVCPQAMHYDSKQYFVQRYPLLNFHNHLAINPNFCRCFSASFYS